METKLGIAIYMYRRGCFSQPGGSDVVAYYGNTCLQIVAISQLVSYMLSLYVTFVTNPRIFPQCLDLIGVLPTTTI